MAIGWQRPYSTKFFNDSVSFCIAIAYLLGFVQTTQANNNDPCGMVPPIYTGKVPISRTGLQKTYVFYKGGIETFVIRPGFVGNVDNFGMLIPFPTAPSLRKVPDEIFPHIEAAVDPPEVVVDLRMRFYMSTDHPRSSNQFAVRSASRTNVKILKQEAVGMYEVAVLEAGSAKALQKWMDDHGYQYPKGMDQVCGEYIDQGWCFVAVKTRVGTKNESDPKPGQRGINNSMPSGSSFDGSVQGMGFRFKSDELVVPMRLSAFNEGDLRNVVYLLTDTPQRIKSIPEEYVVRQLDGKLLYAHLTQPLPLRILGGTYADIPEERKQSLKTERDPYPRNGFAKELFATDLLAVSSGHMSLRHEEDEKELLRIGEYLGLRGIEIDKVNAAVLQNSVNAAVDEGLELIGGMTLTVVDGDFPREVIAKENLTFASYDMPSARNKSNFYDAKLHAPAPERGGIRVTSYKVGNDILSEQNPVSSTISIFIIGALVALIIGAWLVNRMTVKASMQKPNLK